MLSREKVGQRFRQVRNAQQKTLRDVEGASGFSSTHISEIERGRTSPTIGALIQIASALEKPACYFIEERELDEVCVTVATDRAVPDPRLFDLCGSGIQIESLSQGILSGRLVGLSVSLEAHAVGTATHLPDGADLFVYCLDGEVLLTSEGRALTLESGASIHGAFETPIVFHNPTPSPTSLLLILDPGVVLP